MIENKRGFVYNQFMGEEVEVKSPEGHIKKYIITRTRIILIALVVAITVIAAMFALERNGLMEETLLTAWMNPCTPVSTPTFAPTWDGKTFRVWANIDSYQDNPAPECIYRGILREARDVRGDDHPHTFDLELDSGKVWRVWNQDTYDQLIRPLLQRQVEIRGKYVQMDRRQGGGKGLLVGHITPIGSVCPSLTPPLAQTSDMATFLTNAHTVSYKNSPAQECIYRGVLVGVGDVFFLKLDDGRELRIPRNDTSDMIVWPILDREVEIRGKYVEPDQGSNRGRELKVGDIVASECAPPLTSIFTPIPDGKTLLVDAQTDSYKNSPVPECIYRGTFGQTVLEGVYRLRRDDGKGRGLEVSIDDTSDIILVPLAGRLVEIRGKYMQNDRGERELRVGYITPK